MIPHYFSMKDKVYNFHGTKMTIKVLTLETDGAYNIIHFEHPPNVGPALHMHPRGLETFHIIRGEYTFLLGNENINAKSGDVIVVPRNTPHKFKSGSDGGEFLVISPPGLENYFYEVSQLLTSGSVSWDVELEIAKKHGQIFLESADHWESYASP